MSAPFVTIGLGGDPSLCQADPKCVRKGGHDGDHWPKSEEAPTDGEE